MARANDTRRVTAQDMEAAPRAMVAALGTDGERAAIDEFKALVDQANREWWAERAAIREYLGEQPREVAERNAWLDIGGES